MEILVFIMALIALDMLALRYGVDSRDGVGRDPRLVECRVSRSL
jgi:hypothetical protein